MKRKKNKHALLCPDCGASFQRIYYEVTPEGIGELAEDLSITEDQVMSLIDSGKIPVHESRLPEMPGCFISFNDLGKGGGKVH